VDNLALEEGLSGFHLELEAIRKMREATAQFGRLDHLLAPLSLRGPAAEAQ
jgi:hypothetical protein